MKYIADRGYTDVVLNRHVDKNAVLEEEYKKDEKELTEERIKYLVEERKLYKSVEEVKESEVGEITPTDDIPEGEQVIDRVDIVEDKEETESNNDEQLEEKKEEVEETKASEEAEEQEEVEEKEESKKKTTKNTTKNNVKKEEK